MEAHHPETSTKGTFQKITPVKVLAVIPGLILYLHTAWKFADEGEGTPAPIDEPDELVTGGIYTCMRNPMYIGVLLIIVGKAPRHRSIFVLWWVVACMLGFHNQVARSNMNEES